MVAVGLESGPVHKILTATHVTIGVFSMCAGGQAQVLLGLLGGQWYNVLNIDGLISVRHPMWSIINKVCSTLLYADSGRRSKEAQLFFL